MERMFISGSHGFIGSALSKELKRRNFEVVFIDRGYLSMPFELASFLRQNEPINAIFHLAAYGNKYGQQDDWETVKGNLNSTINLLFASKDIDYKAFINFSSSSVKLPYETLYSATKASGERLCRAFVNKYKKPIISVRPFSVYGNGDDPKHFIPTAIDAFKHDKPLQLSSGSHDWIEINDLIQGLIVVFNNINKLQGKIIDIGTGREISNYAIVSILRDIFMKPGNIIKTDNLLRPYDIDIWRADTAILKLLGFVPQITIEEGLKRLIYDNK